MHLLVLALTTACGEPETPVDHISSASTVGDYVTSTCTTSVVLGLSTQIADEVNCMAPGTLVSFTAGGGIDFTGSAVLPYLAPDARDDLLAAHAQLGATMQVNSAYRTVAQQYLLYRWWQDGRCGITAAATPGNSNHETGRAIDLGNYGAYAGAMGDHGWAHDVAGDPVHFDHLSSPDLRGADVLAFQRLWNRNHPEDPIAEDGDYGPQTGARLAVAPAGGFDVGACPEPTGPEWDAQRGASQVPVEMTSGERAVVWFELTNGGSQTWNVDSTRLGTADPQDHASAFFDEEDWLSPSRPTGVDHATAPGQVGRFSFVVEAPEVEQDTLVSETFQLVEEGVTWFGPADLTIEVLVHPSGDGATGPTDPGASGDPQTPGGLSGGCSASGRSTAAGGGPAAALLLLLLCAVVRHRRTACSSSLAGTTPTTQEEPTDAQPQLPVHRSPRLHGRRRLR